MPRRHAPSPGRRASVLVTTALALAAGTVLPGLVAAARAQTGDIIIARTERNPDAKLVLAADELIYDNDRGLVTALGDVQLEYDGYTVVAREVTYDRNSKRVMASGDVEIVEPGGNRIFADRIDLTDDFSDGFVDALRVEAVNDTRFAAESAERLPGDRTLFNQGVYTACRVCANNPAKPLSWQIKARRVVVNGETRLVEYSDATFELFGQPIAYLPYFRHPDPTVKRKSGFLFPTVGYRSDVGAYLRQPYFLATGTSNDLTLSVTGFTRQGFLGDAEFRQAFRSGTLILRAAGMFQWEPEAFDTRPDTAEVGRGMVAAKGRFEINPRWSFGFDVLAQTDKTFSRTYNLPDYSSVEIDNQVYLRGLADRNYFDLTGYQFLIQAPPLSEVPNFEYSQSEQPVVHPVLDYNRANAGVFGGETRLDVNLTSLSRDRVSAIDVGTPAVRTYGINGTSTRLTADASYRKRLNFNGLLVTPSASLRGDVVSTDGFSAVGSPTVDEGTQGRLLPTLGFEARYPLLVETATMTHVIEPVGQLFIRPTLDDPTLPNEDAQSLVFDTTNLFAQTRFSGYDRLEYGTRANVGLRYQGDLAPGLQLDAVVGQSFHLGGANPYARTDDLVQTGEASGLEDDRSDIVAGAVLSFDSALRLSVEGRFDDSALELRRLETTATYAAEDFGVSAGYTFIGEQPRYGFPDDREELFGSINFRFARYWRAFASATYDLENGRFVSDSVGVNYLDECLSFTLSYAEVHDRYDATIEADRSVTFRIGFRTLGDFDTTLDADNIDLLD